MPKTDIFNSLITKYLFEGKYADYGTSMTLVQ